MPSGIISSPSSPENNAVVGHVRIHCPALVSNCFSSWLLDIENNNIEYPGRPSGVSVFFISFSIPASTPHAITDVAKPVNDMLAFFAHLILSAVTITLLAFILKASAKVFSICKPFIFMRYVSSGIHFHLHLIQLLQTSHHC